MEHATVSMLCNPYNRESLRYIREKNPDGTEAEFLVGAESGKRFPFKNGIPVLYDAACLEGYNLKYNDFYRKLAKFYDLALGTLAVLYGQRESGFRRQYLQLLELNQQAKYWRSQLGLAPTSPSFRSMLTALVWTCPGKCWRNARRT